MVIVVPVDPPGLGSTDYKDNTDYWWPMFPDNITDADGKQLTTGFTEINGPTSMKKGVRLSKEEVINYTLISRCRRINVQ